jgi:hypothetical protein
MNDDKRPVPASDDILILFSLHYLCSRMSENQKDINQSDREIPLIGWHSR